VSIQPDVTDLRHLFKLIDCADFGIKAGRQDETMGEFAIGLCVSAYDTFYQAPTFSSKSHH